MENLKKVLKWDTSKFIFIIAIVAVLFMVCVPIGFLLWESLTDNAGNFTLANYARHIPRSSVQQAFFNSLFISVGISGFGAVLAVTMAFGVSRTNMAGKGLLKGAVIISIMTPPFLLSLAYIILGGPNAGLFNRLLRHVFNLSTIYGPVDIYSIWALLLLGLPMGTATIFLVTFPALENMDPSLEEAARITGGSAFRSAFNVTLPLIKPAIMSGMMLAFGQTLALYGIPRMLNINVLTSAIRESMITMDFKGSAVLSVMITILSLAAVFLYRRSVKSNKKYSTISARGFRPKVMQLKKSRHLFTALGIVYAFFAFLLPYATLIAVSFMRSVGHGFSEGNFTLFNYISIFQSNTTWNALRNSTILAFSTATIVVVVGFVISFILVRTSLKGRHMLDYVSNLPMGIAGTALAMGLIFMYLTPPLNAFRLYGSIGILLIAYCTRQLPSGVRYSQASLLQISTELEEASRISGATWIKTMLRITIPLVKIGMVYAWILAFINAFPELSASVMLRGPNTNVVATAILELWDGAGGFPQAAAFGSVVFLLVAGMVALAQKLVGRSMLERQNETTIG